MFRVLQVQDSTREGPRRLSREDGASKMAEDTIRFYFLVRARKRAILEVPLLVGLWREPPAFASRAYDPRTARWAARSGALSVRTMTARSSIYDAQYDGYVPVDSPRETELTQTAGGSWPSLWVSSAVPVRHAAEEEYEGMEEG